jgi:hypothetical protein
MFPGTINPATGDSLRQLTLNTRTSHPDVNLPQSTVLQNPVIREAIQFIELTLE